MLCVTWAEGLCMQRKHLELNWEGAGYHGFSVAPGPDSPESAEEVSAWLEFEQVLAAARSGDFSGAPRLLTLYDDAGWLLSGACAELIGDIGSRQLFSELRPAVTQVLHPTYSVDLGRSLAIWGHLSVVPTLLETLAKIAEFVDAPVLVQMLSVLLETEPRALGDFNGPQDIAAYSARVNRQVDVVASRLGTVDAIVMFGERFSVEKLVGVMRRTLNERSRFDLYLRHKFEATTGVDCSGFYEDESLQPRRALALLDAFEGRGGAREFEPGRRYFFGHPVPD